VRRNILIGGIKRLKEKKREQDGTYDSISRKGAAEDAGVVQKNVFENKSLQGNQGEKHQVGKSLNC